jgi:hypothetical protein
LIRFSFSLHHAFATKFSVAKGLIRLSSSLRHYSHPKAYHFPVGTRSQLLQWRRSRILPEPCKAR